MGKSPFALLSPLMKPHDFSASALDESLMTCIIIGQAGGCSGVREKGTKWDVKIQKQGLQGPQALSAHSGRALL